MPKPPKIAMMSTSVNNTAPLTPLPNMKDEAPVCGPTENGIATKESTYIIPSPDELRIAGKMPVLDSEGRSHQLRSIYTNDSGAVARNLIIFIRHFACTVCQQYIRHLASALPPLQLAGLSPPTRISIIGCGDATLITRYKRDVPCPFDLYTDPTAKLYAQLGMGRNLAMGNEVPDYLDGKSMFQLGWEGVLNVLRQPQNTFKMGDWMQIGGEFLWVREDIDGEAGWKCVWAHRMRTTRDHAEVAELKEQLRIDV